MALTTSDDCDANAGRGQMGTGSLIIFIAMILVAVVSAGVLFGIADNLESQAQATGQESSAQISDEINVLAVAGTVDDESEEITTVEITLASSEGSNPMDLENFVVEAIGVGEQHYYSGEELDVNVDGEFGSTMHPDDRGTITIELREPLEPGDDASLVIVSDGGAKTSEQVFVPSDLEPEATTRL